MENLYISLSVYTELIYFSQQIFITSINIIKEGLRNNKSHD